VSEISANSKIVLVVDDNATMRKLLTAQLTRLGVIADTANDGQEALDMIANTRYRIVFMDVQMPVLDGLEATRRLREREKETGRHETIVALTGHCSRADCLAAGMDDYVAKPMNIATLKNVVEKWVDSPQPAST
jgi:CheY-like chemotaxis protein